MSSRRPVGPLPRAPDFGQRGVALAIVVWFIAGMSLLVAGIVAHVRVDTQMSQLHMARAKVTAAGDGAIQMRMAELVSLPVDALPGQRAVVQRLRIGEVEVDVIAVPTAGLIDLNSASLDILRALFIVAGGLGESQAQIVADNVLKWRSRIGARASPGASAKFDSVEDLLRVEGVSRTLFDAVRDYTVAGAAISGRTDWSLAPQAVWQVLALADPQKAQAVLARGALAASDEAGGLGREQVAAGVLRVDSRVRYGDKTWQRRRWIAMSSEAGALVPWTTLRAEPARVIEQ